MHLYNTFHYDASNTTLIHGIKGFSFSKHFFKIIKKQTVDDDGFGTAHL